MATGINLSGLRKRNGEKVLKLIKIFKEKKSLIFLPGTEVVVEEIIAETGSKIKTIFKPESKNLDVDLKLYIMHRNSILVTRKSVRPFIILISFAFLTTTFCNYPIHLTFGIMIPRTTKYNIISKPSL